MRCLVRVTCLVCVIELVWLQVGDGTTSVVLLAGEFLKQVKPFVEEGVHPQIIVRAFRKATTLVSSNTHRANNWRQTPIQDRGPRL